MDLATVDLAAFTARAEELLKETSVTRLEPASLRPVTKYWKEAFLDLPVKTSRTWYDSYDCEALGSEVPCTAAEAAMKTLAAEFGVTFERWEMCEKGWGSFYFKA